MTDLKNQKWHRLISRWLVLVASLVAVVTLAGCQATTKPQESGKINVVATLGFYGEAAKAILDNQGHVHTIINSPSIDAESYEPDVKTAKLVAKANVVVENGLGYDSWMDRVVAANEGSGTKTLSIGKLMDKTTGDNPHLWSDPTVMTKVTQRLVHQFSRLNPQNAAAYQRRGTAYVKKLAVLDQTAKQIKRHANGQKVAVSEPVFDFALHAMGYQVSDEHFAKAIEEDSDPTPADITQLQHQIKHHQIAFFVENTQNSSRNVTTMVQLARKYHVPVVKVTETMPTNQTYRTWMLSQYRQVQRIQQEEQR